MKKKLIIAAILAFFGAAVPGRVLADGVEVGNDRACS